MADVHETTTRKPSNVLKTFENLTRNLKFKAFAEYKNARGTSLSDVVPDVDEWKFDGMKIRLYGIAHYTYKKAIMAFAERNNYATDTKPTKSTEPTEPTKSTKSTKSAESTVVVPTTPPREDEEATAAATLASMGRRRSREPSTGSDDDDDVVGRRAAVRAKKTPALDSTDIIIFPERDLVMVANKHNMYDPQDMAGSPSSPSSSSVYDDTDEDEDENEMTFDRYSALIDKLGRVATDFPKLLRWVRSLSGTQLRRYAADIERCLQHGASSKDVSILEMGRYAVVAQLHLDGNGGDKRGRVAATAAAADNNAADVGTDNAKVKTLLQTFLTTSVTIEKDGMPDLYPETSFAKRQPLKILRQKTFEALDAVIDKKVVCVCSMMQTFKTASQAEVMLLEMARGNMVCMLMGSEGGAVDKYTENIKDIIGIVEKASHLEYTVTFARGDDMADAIARHEAGHPVVVIALAHHTQLSKICDGLRKKDYFDKVAVIIDEVHSKMSPPKNAGGSEHSQRCMYMKEMIKGTARAYLVSATPADVIFNIDDASFGIPGDQIQYLTGPDADWIGWSMYLGIDSLQPSVRVDGPFYKHHYVKETLFGCDVEQVAVHLPTNMDMLNRVDHGTWSPAWRAFIGEAHALKGFVFTRPTYIRNVFMNTELINLIHLKSFDCVTVMMHGSASGNAKSNAKFDLVIEPSVKSAHPCIVMWRNPDSIFWTDEDSVASCTTREAWRSAVEYRCFKSWTDACKNAEVRARVANRMIFMSTNLDGGSVSIVQKTLGRSITHITVAHMSDYNNVIQMIGRAFHNQPDVEVMCLRHGAEGAVEEDRERYVYGKPIVRAFMSATDIGGLKDYFHLTDEMCANKKRFGAVQDARAMYTKPTTAFMRNNEVGLGVARVTQRVAVRATLDVGARVAQSKWGHALCPSHIGAVIVEEEEQEQQQREQQQENEQGTQSCADGVTALLRRFCSDPRNVGKHGTITTFNAMLAVAFPTTVERIVSSRRDRGVLRPECMVHGASMCSIPGVREEVVNGQRMWRIMGRTL